MSFKYTISQIITNNNTGHIDIIINGDITLTICNFYYSIYRKKIVIHYHSIIPFKEIYFDNHKELREYVSHKVNKYINKLKDSIK